MHWKFPERVKVCHKLEWNPRAFYKQHEYDVEYLDFLEQAVVLVAAEDRVQASTVTQYLHQCWPHLADVVLATLKGVESRENLGEPI